MRLFVAAEIGDVLAGRATQLVHQLQKRALEIAPRARLTWLTSERLHITVRFIGEVDEARGETIAKALEVPLSVEPFEMRLEGTGAFPKGGPPRTLWAGVTAGTEQFIRVEREVTARLTPLDVPAEKREYRAHLTLARVRDAAGLRTVTLLDGLTDVRIGTTRINAITLFQSKLSPKGPTYVPLVRAVRGGAPR